MTLTEQWKKGKLEDYKTYYVRLDNGCIERLEYIKKHNGFGYAETDWVVEVLAPVPSYEEYMSLVFYKEDLTKACKMRDKIIKKYEDIDDWWKKENQQLKELLKECREASLDYGNHSGNYELYDRIDNAIGEEK